MIDNASNLQIHLSEITKVKNGFQISYRNHNADLLAGNVVRYSFVEIYQNADSYNNL